jgi:hypothetical protein
MSAIIDCVAQIPKLLYDWKMWKTQLKLSGVDCSPPVQEITAFYSVLKANRKQR